MTDSIQLFEERTFRQTPGVHFADISIPHVNGLDLVEHSGPSVSPPSIRGIKQWYVHRYQTDHNRVLRGRRLFELYFDQWITPHWYVMLDEDSGALRIPPGCLHRSYSGNEGSLLINQAQRLRGYDENKEFIPVQTIGWRFCSIGYHNTTEKEVRYFIQTGEVLG